MKKIVLLLLVLTASLGHCQQNLKLANKYFEQTDYSAAIPLYEQAVGGNKTAEAVRNLADSYYFTGDFQKAQGWYSVLAKDFKLAMNDAYFFRYVHSLKATGNYDEAYKILRINSKTESSLASLNNAIKDLDAITADGTRFSIQLLPINTANSEFGAVGFNDMIVFSGSGNRGNVYKWNDENYLDLLVIPVKDTAATDVIAKSFSDEINTKMHEGSAIFTKDGNVMYFTRNNYKDGRRANDKQNTSHLQIYRAERVGKSWGKIIAMPFNSDNYSTEHPALSADEQTLYFASDMPGSLGSFDLYSVPINNGVYGIPTNLGTKINTAQKEQFPFVAADGTLYFASDGHFGYGALDIFASASVDGEFTEPINVGPGVNSGYDDFSYTINAATKKGYFASNRPSGKGSDDIYKLFEKAPIKNRTCKQYIAGVVTDFYSKQPLQDVLLVLLDADKNEVSRATTHADGNFRFTVQCRQTYQIFASKTLYSRADRTLVLESDANKIYDASMQLKPETAADKLAANPEEQRRIDAIISNEPDVVKVNGRLMIKTRPIYFDYDLWYIRKESKPILNRVIELMNQYPNITVEIGSHTDVRGNNKYNLDLSGRRAASTRDYFIANGVAATRVKAKGYGETVNIVRCVPEESCSEEQHELNRRSEFVIIGI